MRLSSYFQSPSVYSSPSQGRAYAHNRPRAKVYDRRRPRAHSCYRARGCRHVHPGAESYSAGFSGVCSCPCSHPQGLLDTLLPSTFLDLLTLVVLSSFQAPLSLQVRPGSLVPLSLPVRTSFLASFLHCFCPAPRLLLLCWLHLAQLLHIELPGSQCSVLAPPPASEPMTPRIGLSLPLLCCGPSSLRLPCSFCFTSIHCHFDFTRLSDLHPHSY